MFDARQVIYVTSSDHKREEADIIVQHARMKDGSLVGDHFDISFEDHRIDETLVVDLESMVKAEVIDAYKRLKIPCIVEHAGLIFEEFAKENYPGGLTKPMWNALGQEFVNETKSAGRSAVARAVVAYCDGVRISTFIGETRGRIASEPRGARNFYWDTVFIPDGETRTYAEIVEADGLVKKVTEFSQSTKALLKFLEYRRIEGLPKILWS